MAIGMFKLSYKQRQQLSSLFIILNIVQIVLGFGMTSSSIYILIAVAPVLHTETAEIDFAFTVTSIYGTHVMFHWMIGIKMCRKSLKQAHKKSTSDLLLLWYCAGTNTVIILIIISHFARKNGKHIIKSMKNSITTGMTHYLRDATWKETIDKLQYNNECCGITSHENWHEIEWLNKYHVNVNSQTVKQFRTSQETLKLPVTPWSCCRIDFPMQCLHDPLQQEQYAHIWVDEPTVVTDSINTKGCLDGLRRPIVSIINLFIFFTSVVFVLHIIIFIISRLLFTSSRNAVLLNDLEGIAPGWVFGRGDCGYSRGKTLGEIMGMTNMTIVEDPIVIKQKGNFSNLLSKRFKRKKRNSGLSKNEVEKSEELGLLGNADQTGHDQDNSFQPDWHSSIIGESTAADKYNDTNQEPVSMEGELDRLMHK